MLYRFTSQASADVIMLQPQGRRILDLIGKDPEAPGIILPSEMAGVVQRLQQAVQEEEAARERRRQEAEAQGDDLPEPADRISLRQRVTPLIEMLRHAQREDCPVVWGV